MEEGPMFEEPSEDCASYEDARNRALKFMEDNGGPIGAYYQIEIGRLGVGLGAEVGVSSTVDPYRRIRLDYDPFKGPHFNVEVGKGSRRVKRAFKFPGTEQDIAKQMANRAPRG
jgi:hypothetical protein